MFCNVHFLVPPEVRNRRRIFRNKLADFRNLGQIIPKNPNRNPNPSGTPFFSLHNFFEVIYVNEKDVRY